MQVDPGQILRTPPAADADHRGSPSSAIISGAKPALSITRNEETVRNRPIRPPDMPVRSIGELQAAPAGHRARPGRASASCVPSSTIRPLVHHQDAVGRADGREPMGDDQGGAALHQPVERGLDLALALGIERRGRLVEKQDRRILQDRRGRWRGAGAGRPTGSRRARRSGCRSPAAWPG